ncbi:MAG: hypothetical protein HY904_13135 [Deltaproteobacteria bacterium]|nr:hypothetical protein [Deltaproteobacteria bacterium]
MLASALLAVVLHAAAPPAPGAQAPAIAVLEVAAKEGASKELAELLGDNIVQVLRREGRFARVVSASDVAAALGFESQRQLVDCDKTSCMSEIANSMGVDLLLTAAVGRLPDGWILNIKIINVRSAATEGLVSRAVKGLDARVLYDAIAPSVIELLAEARLQRKEPAVAARAPLQWPLRAGGLGGFALAAAGAVLGALAVAAAGTVLGYAALAYGAETRRDLLQAALLGALAMGAVAAVGVLAGIAVGVGATAVSFAM